jgi:hypothetical protein
MLPLYNLYLCGLCLGGLSLITSFHISKIIKMAAAASNLKRSSSKECRCNLCGIIFDNAETLNSHKKMDHSQEGHQIPARVG